MCDKANGDQAIFQHEVPQTIYTRCLYYYNHQINLVKEDICKNIPQVATFFTLLQKIYNFISRSTLLTEFMKLQKLYNSIYKCV